MVYLPLLEYHQQKMVYLVLLGNRQKIKHGISSYNWQPSAKDGIKKAIHDNHQQKMV